MKNTELTKLREQSVAELSAQVQATKRQLLDGRIKRSVEGKGLGMQARKLRRDVARLLTIITQKQKPAGAAAKATAAAPAKAQAKAKAAAKPAKSKAKA